MMKRKGKEDEVRDRCPAIREEMTGARSEMRGTAPPGFFVTVAFKGVRFCVSPLDATLVEWRGSVASKGVSCNKLGCFGECQWEIERRPQRGGSSWVLAERGAERHAVDCVEGPHGEESRGWELSNTTHDSTTITRCQEVTEWLFEWMRKDWGIRELGPDDGTLRDALVVGVEGGEKKSEVRDATWRMRNPHGTGVEG
jgi:hypothetical protein